MIRGLKGRKRQREGETDGMKIELYPPPLHCIALQVLATLDGLDIDTDENAEGPVSRMKREE